MAITQTAAYFCTFVLLGFVPATFGPTLPILAEHTGSNLGGISFLFTARSLGFLLGSFQGARLYDRIPGHRVMAAALLLMAAMMVFLPAAPLLWLLAAIVLILGVTGGASDVGGNILLVWVHGHRVGPYMNGLHFFWGVGSFLAPVIVAQAVLSRGDIHWAFWLVALLLLPVAAWLLRLPSPIPQTAPEDATEGQVNRLLVGLFALFLFLYAAAEISFGGWIFSYAVAESVSDATMAAYLTAAFWGAITVGRLLAIPVAARLQPRYVLLGDLVGCMVSVGVVLVGANWPAAIWLGTIGLGLSMASIFPTTISLAERRMAITGKVTGWFFVGVSTGGMSIPWLVGQFFEPLGPRAAMATILLDLLVMAVVYLVLVRAGAGLHATKPNA